MAKIRRPPPAGIMKYLVDRFCDGRVAVDDFVKLKHWLESDVEVPDGMWFKCFANFTLAGEGDMPKTFLTRRMTAKGTEVL